MRLIALVSCVCAGLGGSLATAETLRSVPVTFYNFFPRGTPMGAYKDDLVFSVGLRPFPPLGEYPPLTPIPNELFDAVRFNPRDVGKTVRLTPSDDPDFAGFVAMLTNGTPDQALVSTRAFAEGGSPGSPEGSDQYVNGNGEVALFSINGLTDLRGYQIDSISERIDSLTITDNVVPNPSAPNVVGRQFDGQVTLTIEGSPTPEPGSAAMLVLAGCGWLSRRRRTRG